MLNQSVDRPMKIMESALKASKEVVLLGVRTDSDLTFKEHITRIFSKANQKLNTLTKVSKYIRSQNRRILLKSLQSLIIVQ